MQSGANRGAWYYVLAVVAGIGALLAALAFIEALHIPLPACMTDAVSAACARQRIAVLLPWLGMGVCIALLITRTRRTAPTVSADQERGTPLARLHIISGPDALIGRDILLYAGVTVIGRDPALADVQLYSPRERSSISPSHCTVRYDRGQFTLTDNHSLNGTQINGRAVAPETPVVLRNGDEIALGDAARRGAILRFQAHVPVLSILPTPPQATEDLNRTGAVLPESPERTPGMVNSSEARRWR